MNLLRKIRKLFKSKQCSSKSYFILFSNADFHFHIANKRQKSVGINDICFVLPIAFKRERRNKNLLFLLSFFTLSFSTARPAAKIFFLFYFCFFFIIQTRSICLNWWQKWQKQTEIPSVGMSFLEMSIIYYQHSMNESTQTLDIQ